MLISWASDKEAYDLTYKWIDTANKRLDLTIAIMGDIVTTMTDTSRDEPPMEQVKIILAVMVGYPEQPASLQVWGFVKLTFTIWQLSSILLARNALLPRCFQVLPLQVDHGQAETYEGMLVQGCPLKEKKQSMFHDPSNLIFFCRNANDPHLSYILRVLVRRLPILALEEQRWHCRRKTKRSITLRKGDYHS